MANQQKPKASEVVAVPTDPGTAGLPWHLRSLPEDIARRLMSAYQPKPITGRTGPKPGY